MSEQDERYTSAPRSRLLPKQNKRPTPVETQRPANDDNEEWKTYWDAEGQPWRTEPEIDIKRKRYLTDTFRVRLSSIQPGRVVANRPMRDAYSLKDIKLSRADVEWLLATHENGRGPVDWRDESQRNRKGLDLKGADLKNVDLSRLPLANMNKMSTHIAIPPRGDILSKLPSKYDASLIPNRRYESVAKLMDLEGADFRHAHLEGADFGYAHLEGADFRHAHLEGADFRHAHLENAFLSNAHLEGVNLEEAHLEGAFLDEIFLDSKTNLNGIVLFNNQYGGAFLADIHWGDADIAVVDWSAIHMLGDERLARRESSLDVYQVALRAYRQLTIKLREQGLNEDAARFAYRAQLLQRQVLKRQRKFGTYLFSQFLDLLAGYGYKPWRSFLAYLLVIGIFAALYYHLGAHLAWNEALVISMTAFHGRGFFPDQFHPGDPQALVAAIEAFVGLLIEVTFIATLTQRLFGK